MNTDTLTPVVQVPGQLDLPAMPAISEPAATKPATTTKLTGLTNSNTTALTGVGGWTVTKTTATYTGTPVKALASVQTQMNTVRAAEGGRASGYQSLIAVRNKLKELSTGGSHPAVSVTIKRATKKPAKTRTGSPAARLTRKRQDTYTTAQLVATLESGWDAIRANHREVPAVVIIVGSGTSTKQAKYGHFATNRWQHGDNQLAEVLISGEGLKRSAEEVFITLLHEATHGLAEAREIKDTSRQGRWHNQKFADLASELGLDPSDKDPKHGWSKCTLPMATADIYKTVIADLKKALIAYRHPETTGEGTKKNNNNAIACVCQCPRRIRVAKAVLAEGDITCGNCESTFEADE